MKNQKTWAALCLLIVSVLAGCYPEHDPNQTNPALTETNGGNGGGDGVGVPDAGNPIGEGGEATVVCPPAVAQPLPARSEVMSGDTTPMAQRIFTKDLFSLFSSNCGGCHVEANQGGFQGQRVNLQNFTTLVDQDAVDAIFQTDPTKIMPPGSKPPSTRAATDPVLQLGNLLKAWIAHDRPTESFFLEPDVAPGTSLLQLSKAVGANMTNLGNCIPKPDPAVIASESDQSVKLDKMFAHATTLPVNLSDTDLFTLDSAELARYGVIAFAPAYPLWADDAKKVRMVRVPRGKSIQFDKATQKFDIPENTRFYKTFLKQVVDVSGNVTFKKIETRLIVSRPDSCDKNGQNCTQNALFGTYAWDEGETKATLVQDLLRNETPFADRVFTYITDEQKAASSKDPSADGLTRTYAIPGSTRCVQCHMGSVSQSFVLGFAPLQIRRRPKASAQITDGAIIEDTNTDELSQFQRLIDYGIITGAESEKDVVKLEESEASAPRNVYEVNAQGYMTGNCGHCHNPRGYPSIQHPELANVLKFWPAIDSGIFQFPINTLSPLKHRGLNGEFAVPYITQSIDDTDYGNQSPTGVPAVYTDKVMNIPATDGSGTNTLVPVLAPWRSLIYRNVDTPFTYTEANAVFPHMPLNTPGYDCRVPQIMGDWMVSIPVQRVKQGPVQPSEILPYTESLPTDAYYGQHQQEATARMAQYHASSRYNFCPDTSDIVDPDVVSGKVLTPQDNGYPLPGYTAAQVKNPLIHDQLVFKDGIPDRPHWVVTDPTENPPPWTPRRSDYGVALLGDPPDPNAVAVPVSDDLARVIQVVGQGDIKFSSDFNDFALQKVPAAYWDPSPAGATADQLAACATTLAAQKKYDDYSPDQRLPWQDSSATPAWLQAEGISAAGEPRKKLPVYETSIGAMVFDQICRNCHGPNADGKSSLADTLLSLTGGVTRVADLRDGIFGPSGMPGTARASVFAADAAAHHLTTDDIAVRYVAFMGLGGTLKPIPDAVLEEVKKAQAFGEYRIWGATAVPATANMLASARLLCGDLLFKNVDFDVNAGIWPDDQYAAGAEPSPVVPLFASSGDGDMWQRLCYRENPGPVLALEGDQWLPGNGDIGNSWNKFHLFPQHRFLRSAYPANTPIGGANRQIASSLTDDNVVPWCITPPEIACIGTKQTDGQGNVSYVLNGFSTCDPDLKTAYQGYVDELWNQKLGRSGDPIPYCPTSLWDAHGAPIATSQDDAVLDSSGSAFTDNPFDKDWSIRAAANAARAVFAYVDAVSKGLTPAPRFNECYLVNQSGM